MWPIAQEDFCSRMVLRSPKEVSPCQGYAWFALLWAYNKLCASVFLCCMVAEEEEVLRLDHFFRYASRAEDILRCSISVSCSASIKTYGACSWTRVPW